MSAFLRTETPSPVRNPFSIRTDSQVSKTHPVVAPSTVRGVVPALRDEPMQPRTPSAAAQRPPGGGDRPEPILDDTVGRHDVRVPPLDDTVGRHDLRVPSLDDTVGRHDPRMPSLDDTVGRHEPRVPSLDDTVGRNGPRVPALDDTMGRHEAPFSRGTDSPSFRSTSEPRAGWPNPSPVNANQDRWNADAGPRAVATPPPEGGRQTPVATRPHMPLVAEPQAAVELPTDSAGVMRRVKRRPGASTGAPAAALLSQGAARSHADEQGAQEPRIRPVVGAPASGAYHLPVTSSDPLLEEGDMGSHADERAARPMGEHEQVTRIVDAPGDMFSKALRLDDTLVDRPVVPATAPAESPQGTVRGVDWRLSDDDRAVTTTDDAVSTVQDATRSASPLASLPTAPMTRPTASADLVDEFAATQSPAPAATWPAARPNVAKRTEQLSWQDAMSVMQQSTALPQPSPVHSTGEDAPAARTTPPVNASESGSNQGGPSAASEGPGVGRASVAAGPPSAASDAPAPRQTAAAPVARPGVAQPSGFLDRLRSMGLPAMSRDTVVALVVGITVLFVALLFLVWVLAR
ncbi:MAG: hypothetical protein KGO50_05315 [Myxococcales bacterium]|nr:hypothetical protein [Myxococcales bacterium]